MKQRRRGKVLQANKRRHINREAEREIFVAKNI